ncbi:retrovirus-related pol polyprotein from transposon TNT 1-94 [Tanacetum coccineum]|uniref:Retrovirus-related pol polyprotein from transposon TNT 1-94 n=1 Tax=Tanacetum coccineum TaxID=301880 RepID=A0ABQ5CQL9_9ASTR
MALTAYADADHAGCQDTQRSTSGSAQFFRDKLVSWSSKKQKSTAISTTEAEYIAMSGCSAVLLLYAATMSSTLGPSTLTSDTISLESRKEKRSKGWSSYILYKMADENVPAPAPTRSDDQILPFAAWVPIEKSNHVLDLQKRKKNPIFQIAMDILQNINFFKAFTVSASVPAIYIQQFWNTLTYITPIDQAHPFVSPPSGDAIMDFMNELGYPEARLLGMIGAMDNKVLCGTCMYYVWHARFCVVRPNIVLQLVGPLVLLSMLGILAQLLGLRSTLRVTTIIVEFSGYHFRCMSVIEMSGLILNMNRKGCEYKYGGQRNYKHVTTHSYLVLLFTQIDVDTIMSPKMRTQSAGRPAAESLGGGTGERVSRGGRGRRPREHNDERVDELNGQGND